MMRTILLFGLLGVTACSDTPRAPTLSNSPVYQNDNEGFRFLIADEWKMSSRGEVPPGKVDVQRVLVQYQRQFPSKPATIEVSRIDSKSLPELEAMLREISHGIPSWQPNDNSKPLEVSGVGGTQLLFRGQTGKATMTKQVVIVPRGEKNYLFTAIYREGDESARNHFQNLLASVVWQ
jgi:hypothetical protein